jgi:hypothetical protein
MKQKANVDEIIPILMPNSASALLLGLESERFNHKYRVIHPLLMKAVRDKFPTLKSGDLFYDKIVYHFYQTVLEPKQLTYVPLLDDFHITWLSMMGIDSSSYSNLSKRLFQEAEIFRGHKNQMHAGLDIALLYFISKKKQEEPIQNYYKKNIMALIPVQYNTREERHNSLMYTQMMLLDYGNEALEWDEKCMANMMSFYAELTNANNLSQMYMSPEWETSKALLKVEAERLDHWVFEKLIKADLPLDKWHEHEELPREWVVGLYT